MEIGNNFKLTTNKTAQTDKRAVLVINTNTVNSHKVEPPVYLKTLKFPYNEFTEIEKNRYIAMVNEYRNTRRKQLEKRGKLLNDLMQGMLKTLGYIDYPKLVKTYEHEKSMFEVPKNINEENVIIYYNQLADMSTDREYERGIMVEPSSGNLKPISDKVNENLGYTCISLDDVTNFLKEG